MCSARQQSVPKRVRLATVGNDEQYPVPMWRFCDSVAVMTCNVLTCWYHILLAADSHRDTRNLIHRVTRNLIPAFSCVNRGILLCKLQSAFDLEEDRVNDITVPATMAEFGSFDLLLLLLQKEKIQVA